MDDFYRHDPCADSGSFENVLGFEGDFEVRIQGRSDTEICTSEMSDLIKAQIASHPKYPNLVSAYIECRKVKRKQNKIKGNPINPFFFLFFFGFICSISTCFLMFW